MSAILLDVVGYNAKQTPGKIFRSTPPKHTWNRQPAFKFTPLNHLPDCARPCETHPYNTDNISLYMIIIYLLFHYCSMFPNFPTFGFSSIFCFSGPLWHPTDLQICQLARHPSSLPEPRLSDASGPFGAAVETPAQWRGDKEGSGELSRSLGGAGNWKRHFEF